jgi:hypothetical protein
MFAPNIRDDHSAVVTNGKLGSMCVADTDSLAEPERGFEPRHSRAHIGVNEHRGHRRGRRRTIRQHDP